MCSQKKRLNKTLLMSTKLNNKTGEQKHIHNFALKIVFIGHIIISVSEIER